MTARIVRRETGSATLDLAGDLHPVLRRVYANRGIKEAGEIDHRLAGMLSPMALGGMLRACALLEDAIRNDARIIVVGDFDCDGATGAAVAVRGLRMLGAGNVEYAVPNRMRHGYGLSPGLLEELLPRRPQLLLTVDNGIAAHAGIAAAKAHDIKVIVTDHHLPAQALPPADAIVNPNALHAQSCAHAQDSSANAVASVCTHCAADLSANRAFASRALAGVGVVFYVLLALRARLYSCDDPDHQDQKAVIRGRTFRQERPDLSSLLDLVAVGTVADLVPLDRNNRILVSAGLRRIRAGRSCAGIRALMAVGKVDAIRATATDLGFRVAPRINAAGRLEDMGLGIECLLTDDFDMAREFANTLDAINAQRRQLQGEMLEQADRAVERWRIENRSAQLPIGMVMFDPQWHPGVVGLVASKMRESLHRPVIACAPAAENPAGTDSDLELKASGRSVPGFHLRDALAEVDARHPGLMLRFGGHAMAAGLSLSRRNLDAFASAFDDVVRDRIAPDSLQAVIRSDGQLSATDYNLQLAQCLREAGPWGQAFPEPAFDEIFTLRDWKVVGDAHLRMTLQHEDHDRPLAAIMFGGYKGQEPPRRLRVVFHLDVNEWNNSQTLQLVIRHLEPA